MGSLALSAADRAAAAAASKFQLRKPSYREKRQPETSKTEASGGFGLMQGGAARASPQKESTCSPWTWVQKLDGCFVISRQKKSGPKNRTVQQNVQQVSARVLSWSSASQHIHAQQVCSVYTAWRSAKGDSSALLQTDSSSAKSFSTVTGAA